MPAPWSGGLVYLDACHHIQQPCVTRVTLPFFVSFASVSAPQTSSFQVRVKNLRGWGIFGSLGGSLGVQGRYMLPSQQYDLVSAVLRWTNIKIGADRVETRLDLDVR